MAYLIDELGCITEVVSDTLEQHQEHVKGYIEIASQYQTNGQLLTVLCNEEGLFREDFNINLWGVMMNVGMIKGPLLLVNEKEFK